jgi:hypothetical protein
MRGDTWLKIATGIWILSALGGVIALAKGVQIASVVESVGYLWILLAMLVGKRIALHFPQQHSEIAFGAAIASTAAGVASIYYNSTEHVALTLMTVSIFWNIAADLLPGRKHVFLLNTDIADIYRFFRAAGQIQRSPIERVLDNGALVLMLASIVCLFTITTWRARTISDSFFVG